MPEEPWNHLGNRGPAPGKYDPAGFDMEKRGSVEKSLFERPKGQEKTFHRFDDALTGPEDPLHNVEQETPIGELAAYYVAARQPPPAIAN